MELLAEIKSERLRKETRSFIHRQSDEFALGTGDWSKNSAQTFAEDLAESFVDNTQIRGLVALAQSTGSIADILDTIKIRVGRDAQRKGWAKGNVGSALVETLKNVQGKVERFVVDREEFRNEDPDVPRKIHLQLCRSFISHIAAHFEYVNESRGGVRERDSR